MADQNIPEHDESPAMKWEDVFRHLENSRSFLEKGSEATEEERKKILRARAKKLAQASVKTRIDEGGIEVLEFLLAHERYAVETAYVSEVYPLKEITVLPCTPSFLLGIINVRGQILSVIDIKRLFDLPEKGITNLNRVIIVKDNDIELGILSDEITGIRTVPGNDLQTSASTLSGIHAEYLKGVTSKQLIILDIKKLLADQRIIIHEEVMA